ncbi:MAG TPA: CoA transferase [Acidimicrobiales bacterium]|nr:CoA transferase [Acidimicrobiales bacterium]
MEVVAAEAGRAPAARRPLEGVRVLAVEQMQALPYATQLMARLGADVVKIEPLSGDLGRSSVPAMVDPEGRPIGATFLRNNLSKRSMCVDLKHPEGRQLVLDLAPRFDVFAENFKPGAMSRLGLGFDDVSAVHPTCVYASVSGFGNSEPPSPYRDWPAFAPIVEAMSGVYEMKREKGHPPTTSPVGALGDIGAALFTAVGILAALRDRDRTGRCGHVDVAMLDSVMAMTDIVVNYWSMGVRHGDSGALINHGFLAADGWFVMQVAREHHFERLAELVGCPEWIGDARFANREGWVEHLDDVVRPAIEHWAAGRTRLEVAEALGRAGIAAGPCWRDEELVNDPHVASRRMVVGIERPDGGPQPVLVPGNPVKVTGWPDGGDRRIPWLGEHTDEILRAELALGDGAIAALRSAAVIA